MLNEQHRPHSMEIGTLPTTVGTTAADTSRGETQQIFYRRFFDMGIRSSDNAHQPACQHFWYLPHPEYSRLLFLISINA